MMLITGPRSLLPFNLLFSHRLAFQGCSFPRGVEIPDLAMDANHQDSNSVSEGGGD